jgi:hypothetical protein
VDSTGRNANRGLNPELFMRMRGLEPPPGFPDTDLNREGPENMGPPIDGSPN